MNDSSIFPVTNPSLSQHLTVSVISKVSVWARILALLKKVRAGMQIFIPCNRALTYPSPEFNDSRINFVLTRTRQGGAR